MWRGRVTLDKYVWPGQKLTFQLLAKNFYVPSCLLIESYVTFLMGGLAVRSEH